MDNSNLAAFRKALATWTPATHITEDELESCQSWTINPDGSITITIHSVLAFNLADELSDWDAISDWRNREDCKNWKRSPIARENRRESIASGNHLCSMKALLGRHWLNALLQRVKSIKPAPTETPTA